MDMNWQIIDPTDTPPGVVPLVNPYATYEPLVARQLHVDVHYRYMQYR